MQAVRYHEPGGPEVLAVDEVPRPEPAPDEVLVDVRAASVNPVDSYVREGGLSPPGGYPHVGGADLAGVVESVGALVTEFQAGDRVFATGLGVLSSGTYAEYAAVSADVLAPLPESVSFQQGAAGAMACATAWLSLVERGGLTVDDVCVVHGASGGVGHAAVQLAVHAGARAIGTASEGEPTRFVESLGADAVVDYGREDLSDAIRAAAGDRPADVVLETHADANLAADLEALSRGGAIVVIGEEGSIELDPGLSMTAKQADADLRFTSLVASRERRGPVLRRVGPLLAEGALSVRIEATFGLDEVAAAHERLAGSGVLGKLAIDVEG